MGTAILKTTTNAAQNINSAQRTIGTYTNSTNQVVTVVPVVLLEGLGASIGTATYTVEFCPTSSGAVVQQLTRCQLASAPVGGGAKQLLDFQSLTIASGGSTFPREAMQVRPGDSLVVKVQSNSASDTAAVATVYFMDGDAVVASTVSSELTGQNLGTGVYIELAESTENRWVRPRVDLSNWGGAGSNTATLTVIIRTDDYSIALNDYTGQYNDLPDGQTTAILSASTIESIRQPFFVPAGYIMELGIYSTGTSVSSVNVTAYFDVMETPRSGSGAPFIFIDDDQ